MSKIKRGFAALFSARGKISYRRLLAFAAGSAFFGFSQLSEQNWMILALAFMGIEGVQAVVGLMKPAPAAAPAAPKPDPAP